MEKFAWVNEFPGAITVCDANGIITEMNIKAGEVFKKDGGLQLIGSNALDCHPEPSRTQFKKMLENPAPNVYTIEKGGKKKLIYQTPVYEDGIYAGFIELSLEIPQEMPHFNRDAA
jgi:hypothetical protein